MPYQSSCPPRAMRTTYGDPSSPPGYTCIGLHELKKQGFRFLLIASIGKQDRYTLQDAENQSTLIVMNYRGTFSFESLLVPILIRPSPETAQSQPKLAQRLPFCPYVSSVISHQSQISYFATSATSATSLRSYFVKLDNLQLQGKSPVSAL